MQAEAAMAHSPPPGHTGPYTIHDLFAFEDETHRYEVLEGVLYVTPSPNADHQYLGDRLQGRLDAAAPAGVTALTAFTVRLGADEHAPIPDIVVTRAGVKLRRRTNLEADELLAVVETVSPSGARRDRILKPALYAEAGVPYYWRVELEDFPGRGDDRTPVVLVHELDGDCYRLVERLPAGRVGTLTRPFPVDLDPAELLPPD